MAGVLARGDSMNMEIVARNSRGESRFTLDVEGSDTVLDILERLRKDGKPGLLYRHSCHHGSCGTCGAMINGKPRLMCLTRASDLGEGILVIEPLAKMTEIGGIAVWPGPLFDAAPDTDYLKAADDKAEECSENPVRLEDCIECGVCVAACPVSAPFAGPAALAAAAVEMGKHPGRESELGPLVDGPEGAPACERAFECSRVCPQGVAPGRKIIELLKRTRRR